MLVRGAGLVALFLVLSLGAAACSSARVSPIRVKYTGLAGRPETSAEFVEVVRGPMLKPSTPIAELEVESDGSTFEELVERLRRRAAGLGADAICDVRSVFSVGKGQYVQSPGQELPRAADFGSFMKNAAETGIPIIFDTPSWVSVRATAVSLQTNTDLELEATRPRAMPGAFIRERTAPESLPAPLPPPKERDAVARPAT
jgi:hypothetical protein